MSTFAGLHHVGIISPLPKLELPDEVSVNQTQAMFPFYFPTIEILDLFVLNRKDMFSWPKENPPCAFYLTTLNLPVCEVDDEGLRRVLAVTPNLKRLSYHRLSDIRPWRGFHQTPYLNLTILWKAFNPNAPAFISIFNLLRRNYSGGG